MSFARRFVVPVVAAVAMVAIPKLASAGTLLAWDFSTLAGGTNNFGPSPDAAGTTATNATSVGLTRGTGLGVTGSGAAHAWGATNFSTGASTEATAVSASDYATFSITANSGYNLSVADIEAYNIRRSSTGPATGIWQYSTDGTSFTDIGSAITWGSTTSSSGNAEAAINLAGIPALQSIATGTTVTFRVVNWGATSTGGTWYFNDPTDTTANDLVVDGTVALASLPVPAPAAVPAMVACMGLAGGLSLVRRRRSFAL